MHRSLKGSFYIALFVAFLDNMGIGMVYPLFSIMLFDNVIPFFSLTASSEIRGFFLGLSLSIFSIAQFFFSPFWGTFSDGKGRKKTLIISLFIAFLGYFLFLESIFFGNLILLIVSRFITGVAGGNFSVVQATIADLSSHENKAKHFGLLNMYAGVGFTLGPFFGGFLSHFGYYVPFIFALVCTFLNFLLAILFFTETLSQKIAMRFSWRHSFLHLIKAFRWTGLKTIFLLSLLMGFAWTIFIEFMPVYLIKSFNFSTLNMGFFYGIGGGFYAIASGLLIAPLTRKFQSETLYFASFLLMSIVMFFTLGISSSLWIWPIVSMVSILAAIIYTMASTYISNTVGPEIQGEALGILSSIYSLSQILAPLALGSSIGSHPQMLMWLSGSIMLFGVFILALAFRKVLFSWKG